MCKKDKVNVLFLSIATVIATVHDMQLHKQFYYAKLASIRNVILERPGERNMTKVFI